jgi:hypothetical protein
MVVLAIGTAARELDPDLLAIIPNGLVHEHAVVVGVQPEQRERQQLCNSSSTPAPLSAATVRVPGAARIRSSPWRYRSAPRFAQSCRSRPARNEQPDAPRQIRAADRPSRQTCCTGTLRRIAADGADRRRIVVPACRRMSRNDRSIVAALIANNLESFVALAEGLQLCRGSAAPRCNIAAMACPPPFAMRMKTRGRIRCVATRRCARITARSRPATIEAWRTRTVLSKACTAI